MRAATALVLAALALAACDVSDEEEARIGAESAGQVEAQLPLVHDPALQAYIESMGQSIARTTSRADLEWHFAIVNSEVVNAFALPGGYVYINRGLIEHAEREDELAGALGHEIGHVVRRHGVERMKQGTRANIIVSVACALTNVCDNAAGQVAIRVGGSAWFAQHSREDEQEADAEAVQNVIRAGYDPDGIPALFEELLQERQRRPGMLESWFTSHPLEESRIENTRALISAIDPNRLSGLLQDSEAYQQFRARLAQYPRE